MRLMIDLFGDRMKGYERVETSRKFDQFKPVYARIDGRSFSRFTKDMKRPWDDRMIKIMQDVTSYLVEETHAIVGYTQSDEISLLWLVQNQESQMFFNAKVQKLCSVLAGMASSKFTLGVYEEFGIEKASKVPHFDARVFQLPSEVEATNAILWRYLDAMKNSVSMYARHFYSSKMLQGKDQRKMIEMISQKSDVKYHDLSEVCRTGSFVRRRTREVFLDPNDFDDRVKQHIDFDEPVIRSFIDVESIPDFHKATNRTGIIFEDQKPMYEKVDIVV